MSLPLPPSPPENFPPLSSLPRKLLLLFLLAINVALGLIYLLHYGNPVGYLSDLLFASGALGLVSGFGARLVLRDRRDWLRVMAALSMLTIGLILIGVFTGWKYGLGPLSFLPGRFDWKGLVQLVFGSLTAILSLNAWRRPSVLTISVPDDASPQPEAYMVIPNPGSPPKRVRTSRREVGARVGGTAAGKSAKRLRPSTGAKTGSRTRVRSGTKSGAKTIRTGASSPGSKRRSRQANVQFSTSQEHRCPYCLELIQPDDPRGIMECKVCHTLHHADCWAITGTCQVPHLNS